MCYYRIPLNKLQMLFLLNDLGVKSVCRTLYMHRIFTVFYTYENVIKWMNFYFKRHITQHIFLYFFIVNPIGPLCIYWQNQPIYFCGSSHTYICDTISSCFYCGIALLCRYLNFPQFFFLRTYVKLYPYRHTHIEYA